MGARPRQPVSPSVIASTSAEAASSARLRPAVVKSVTIEAGGSEGNLLSLELRWRVHPAWVVTPFYDYGEVLVNRNNNFTVRVDLPTGLYGNVTVTLNSVTGAGGTGPVRRSGRPGRSSAGP